MPAEIATIIGIKREEVHAIEAGNSQNAKIEFRSYLLYAEYVNVTLPDLFTSAIQLRAQESVLQRNDDPNDTWSVAERREQEFVVKVQHAKSMLEAKGEPVTTQAISEAVQVAGSIVRYYPRVRALLNEVVVAQYEKSNASGAYATRQRERTEQVLNAIEVLTLSEKPLTRHAVAEQVGMSQAGLAYYPAIRTLLNEYCVAPLPSQEKQRQRDEAQIIAEIEQAIKTLKAQGKPVTQPAISELVGMSLSGLRYYPGVRAMLEQIAAEGRQAKTIKVAEREQALLIQIQSIVSQLRSEGRKVTQQAIEDMIGVALPVLRRFARVRTLLEQFVTQPQRHNHARTALREGQLMKQVQGAIDALTSRNELVTQLAISQMVEMTPTGLRRYPRVRALLDSLPIARQRKQQ